MKLSKVLLSSLALAVFAVPSFAAQPYASGTTTITVVRNEQINLSVTTQLPMLTLAAGALTSDTQNVVVSSSWNLSQTRTSGVSLCVSAASALAGQNAGTTGNTDTIPVNAIYVTPAGTGSTDTALGGATTNCGLTGAVSYKTYTTTTAATRKNLTGQSDTIPVKVKLASDVAADTYTGQLTITAYVN